MGADRFELVVDTVMTASGARVRSRRGFVLPPLDQLGGDFVATVLSLIHI